MTEQNESDNSTDIVDQHTTQSEALLFWHKEITDKLNIHSSGVIWSLKWEIHLSYSERRLLSCSEANRFQNLNFLIFFLISKSKQPLTILSKCLEKLSDLASHQQLATLLSKSDNLPNGLASPSQKSTPATEDIILLSFEELRTKHMDTLPLYVDIHRLLPLLNKYRLLSIDEYCAIVEATKMRGLDYSLDLLFQALAKHPMGMHMLVKCLWEDRDMSSGHSALAAILTGQSNGLPCSSFHDFISIYANKLRRKYKEGPSDWPSQWPPQKSEKTIRLELVETEKEQTEKQKYGKDRECRRPIHHANLLKPQDSKKPIRRVLVEGQPGSGKTTLCSILAQGWGEGHILQEFNTVMVLPLRDTDIASAKSLEDISFHDCPKTNERFVQHLHETDGEGILFMLDGWDELQSCQHVTGKLFPKLMSGKLLPFASIVVTSRPGSSSQLRSLRSIQRCVEILGFSEQNIKEYIFSEFHSNPTEASKLVEQVLENPMVSAICTVPLNCAIICHLWHTMKEELSLTMTSLYTKIVLNILLHEIKRNFPGYKHIKQLASFGKLPCKLKSLWQMLQKLALKGIIKGMIVFSEDEMRSLLPGTSEDDLYSLEGFGLLQSGESLIAIGRRLSFHFIHLTFQEFLAGSYLSTMSQEQQQKIYRKYHNKPQLQMVWRFFFGLLGSRAAKSPFLSTCMREFSGVQLCHCAFEAANDELCGKVFETHSDLTFRGSLSPHDYLAIGYILEKSATLKQELKIGFSGHLSNKALMMLANSLVFANKFVQVIKLDVTVDTAAVQWLLKASYAFRSLRHLHLSDSPLGPSGVRDLAQLLQMHSNLETVHLATIGINNDVAPVLVKALGNHRGLHWLRLSRNNLGDTCIQSLAHALPNLPNLQGLYLSEVGTTKPLVSMVNALSENCSKLKELHLRGNPLSSNDCHNLGICLSSMKCDTDRLSLDGTSMEDTGLCALTKALTQEHSIVELSLRSNGIHFNGLSGLADVLCTDVLSVHKLYLDNNPLGTQGALHISRTLESNNCTLSWISLYKCNLGTDGATTLLHGLSTNHFLKILNLRENKIGEAFPESTEVVMPQSSTSRKLESILGACHASNVTLQWIDLSSNCLTAEGINIVTAFLYVCRSLKDLITSNCKMTSEDLLRISQSLKDQSSFPHANLRSWDLSNNDIHDKDASTTLEILCTVSCQLEMVHLRENPLSPDIIKCLEERLERKKKSLRESHAGDGTLQAKETAIFREPCEAFKTSSALPNPADYVHYVRANIAVGMTVQCHIPLTTEPCEAFKTSSALPNPADYVHYVRANIAVGMTVQSCELFEEESIGVVVRVDDNGLHGPNVLVFWQQSGNFSWEKFIICKLIDPSVIKVALKYTLKRYMDMQTQHMVQSEDAVPREHPWQWCDGCKMKPIVGPRYHCLMCTDFDFCHRCFENEQTHNHSFERNDGEGLPPVYIGPPGLKKIVAIKTMNVPTIQDTDELQEECDEDSLLEWLDASEDQENPQDVKKATDVPTETQSTAQEEWSHVDNTPLDLNCLKQVSDEVVEVTNWFNFGTALGLPYHTLEKIDRDNMGKTDTCKLHMLAEWLKRNYNTDKHGAPTWKSIVRALTSPSSSLPSVAYHIAEQHRLVVT